MKNYTALYLSMLLFYVATIATALWCVVEFILYLVKDLPFNWWSLWLFIIFLILSTANAFLVAIVANRNKSLTDFKSSRPSFKERLQEKSNLNK